MRRVGKAEVVGDFMDSLAGENKFALGLGEQPLPDQMAGGDAGCALDVIVETVGRHRKFAGIESDLAFAAEILLHQPPQRLDGGIRRRKRHAAGARAARRQSRDLNRDQRQQRAHGKPVPIAGEKPFLIEIVAKLRQPAAFVCIVNARVDASGVELFARRDGDGFVLNGTKRFVLDAHVADTIVVAARTTESDDPADGITLFAIDAKADGVSVRQLKTMDMTRRLCDVTLENVPASAKSVVGDIDRGWPRLDRAVQRSAGMLAAECVGGSQKVLDLSVAYARERIQFGRPIGSFQAVKHKCADMLVDVELGRSAMYYAAWAASDSEEELALAASMAKAFCGEAYTRVAGNGIHVHGGIGFTWEHDMHLYFKRAKANEVLLGDPLVPPGPRRPARSRLTRTLVPGGKDRCRRARTRPRRHAGEPAAGRQVWEPSTARRSAARSSM